MSTPPGAAGTGKGEGERGEGTILAVKGGYSSNMTDDKDFL